MRWRDAGPQGQKHDEIEAKVNVPDLPCNDYKLNKKRFRVIRLQILKYAVSDPGPQGGLLLT